MTTTPPSPIASIAWFITITTMFFVMKYMNHGEFQNWYIGIYILILVIGEYIANLSLSEYLCSSKQWGTVALYTFIPWLVIFGSIVGVLFAFPSWLTPFSNTFGYLMAKLMGVQTVLNDILLPKLEGKDISKAQQEALAHIYGDRSMLINEITTENFDTFWDNMKGLFKPETTDALKDKLRQLVKLKEIVAEYIWYLLTGLLVTSASYNYIINSKCQKSVSDMDKQDQEYNKQDTDDTNSSDDRVYIIDD